MSVHVRSVRAAAFASSQRTYQPAPVVSSAGSLVKLFLPLTYQKVHCSEETQKRFACAAVCAPRPLHRAPRPHHQLVLREAGRGGPGREGATLPREAGRAWGVHRTVMV